MNETMYPIPQHHLDNAGNGLLWLADRLEVEAAALIALDTKRACELYEKAKGFRESGQYFLNL